MSSRQQPLARKLLEKLSNSRDLTISFILHAILVALFGTTVLFQAAPEPPDFAGEPGRFVGAVDAVPAPPVAESEAAPRPDITVSPSPRPTTLDTILTILPSPADFTMATQLVAPLPPPVPSKATTATAAPGGGSPEGPTAPQASAIKAFSDGWVKGRNGIGGRVGSRDAEFEFTAYIGQYAGGDWNSTISPPVNGRIVNGSLPNLLYFMSSRSKNRVKTNYKNVVAVNLGSDELFTARPPFIFLTGTRDFRLSEGEVDNLRKYVQLGGAIWGDSSVPGRNSRFDIAFRREMRRVIPDVGKDWEVIPPSHPIFTKAYFPEAGEIPPGLNHSREPAYCLKIYGEIAILYTANDYGDMWQVGLTDQGQVDLRQNEKGQFVAIRGEVWDSRDVYLRNVAPEPLALTYKFGTNVVIHLLTRWESKTRSAAPL